MKFLVYAFVTFVCIYLILHYNDIGLTDIVIISLSTVVLLLQVLRYSKETFVDATVITDDEDISTLNSSVAFYSTPYNSKSYDPTAKSTAWNNICISSTTPNSLTFNIVPVFTKKTGFYLGNNYVVGPYSNNLNIEAHSTFTIMLTCKHGNLIDDTLSQPIELLKLYANSTNNNGISLYIDNTTLVSQNNVQYGSLFFGYSDKTPLQCLIDPSHQLMCLEKDILSYYFIVKDTDNIRVLYLTEKNNIIYEILHMNIQNDNVTFSNKELVINRFQTWNGNLFNFAIFSDALMDGDIMTIYDHVLREYRKHLDPGYKPLLQKYNDTISKLQGYTTCPYDSVVCDECNTITNWSDHSQVLTSPASCRNAINDYCSQNVTDPLCSCWNAKAASYNTDNCKLYRSIFSSKSDILDTLSPEELSLLKEKYGLIDKNSCPAQIVRDDVDLDLDINRFKIHLHDCGAKSNLKPFKRNYEDVLQPTPTSHTPLIVQETAHKPTFELSRSNSLPKPDAFFDRFLKVNSPFPKKN